MTRAADGGGRHGDRRSGDRWGPQAEHELRRLVIDAERTELDRLLARRKISERVADGVRAALDVDETTMRP